MLMGGLEIRRSRSCRASVPGLPSAQLQLGPAPAPGGSPEPVALRVPRVPQSVPHIHPEASEREKAQAAPRLASSPLPKTGFGLLQAGQQGRLTLTMCRFIGSGENAGTSRGFVSSKDLQENIPEG